MKKLFALLLTLGTIVILPATVMAHIVVTPAEVNVDSYPTFTVNVHNPKPLVIVKVRLVIPDGVDNVTPSVKPGWTVTTKTSGTGDNEKTTEINWEGGTIPSHYMDEFLFSAVVPEKESTLTWKAYETYKNGETAAFDVEPKPGMKPGPSPDSKSDPASQTKVVDDSKKAVADQKSMTPAASSSDAMNNMTDPKILMAQGTAILALLVAVLGVVLNLRSKPKVKSAQPAAVTTPLRDDSTDDHTDDHSDGHGDNHPFQSN